MEKRSYLITVKTKASEREEENQTEETVEEEMVLEKGGARATEKSGQTRTEKYEFGKLSISSDLAKDNFGGAVAVEAGLN